MVYFRLFVDSIWQAQQSSSTARSYHIVSYQYIVNASSEFKQRVLVFSSLHVRINGVLIKPARRNKRVLSEYMSVYMSVYSTRKKALSFLIPFDSLALLPSG